QVRRGHGELVHVFDDAVSEAAVIRAAERIQHREVIAALAQLAKRGAHARLADAAPPMLRRHRHRSHARDRHALAAHVAAEGVEHERGHGLAFELGDADVAQRETRVIRIELAALLHAGHAIGAGGELGEGLDVGAPGRAIANRRWPRWTGAHGAQTSVPPLAKATLLREADRFVRVRAAVFPGGPDERSPFVTHRRLTRLLPAARISMLATSLLGLTASFAFAAPVDPWATGTEWYTVRAGYAKSSAAGAPDGDFAVGFGYTRF